jgi:hypothetical protein
MRMMIGITNKCSSAVPDEMIQKNVKRDLQLKGMDW